MDRADWKTAPPLWTQGLAGSVDLDRPAVLRFAGDDFMDEFQAAVSTEQPDLSDYVAGTETWEQEAAGLDAVPDGDPIKLYQPVHGRFYLVTAGLVCARYGLPDKSVHGATNERVVFVMRRFKPTGDSPVDLSQTSSYVEYAWIDSEQRWASDFTDLADGEETFPMFPVTYTHDGRQRRVLAGLVPVGAREKYQAGAVSAPIPDGSTDPLAPLADSDLELLEQAVVGLQGLRSLGEMPAVQAGGANSIDLFREGLSFSMVDLSTFLVERLPDVWDGTGSSAAELAVSAALATSFVPGETWRDALGEAYSNRGLVVSDLSNPPGPVTSVTPAEAARAIDRIGIEYETGAGHPLSALATQLFINIVAALPASSGASSTAPDDESDEPAPLLADGGIYAVRCVYQRPECAPSARIRMSKPTSLFTIAPFHDPEAPFREARIAMPVDTSLEGLRNFPKAVKMSISKELRKQMQRVDSIKLGALDDGDIPDEPSVDFGMICSLSIPIITICALILLMIIVSLLNIVFFWKPLLKICFPKVE